MELRRTMLRTGVAAVALLLPGSAIRAQASGSCLSFAPESLAARGSWSPPLDRAITLHVSDRALRDVLDRISESAKLRLSYSTDLLPLDRVVCISANGVPAGAVLTRLLTGTGLVPIAVGGDQVALAPAPAQAAPTPEMASSVGMLDRVVVTGTADGAPQRELTVGLDVLDGRKLARENTTDLSSALDGAVPGIWSWAQSPSSLVTSYASIRGASSFQLSYPKMYIDGIEVANPLLVARFAPDAVDRIEVIRGPQGSALYGTDAISGVVNIETRYQGTDSDGTHASLRSTAGVTEGDFTHGVLSQDHAASYFSGTSTQSLDVHVSGSTVGDFIPNGYSHELLASSNGRYVGDRTTYTGIARVLVEQAGAPVNPLLQQVRLESGGSGPAQPVNTDPQSASEYTVGGTMLFAPDDRWTHTFVAGLDGYRLANVQTNFTPVPSPLDTALRAAQGGADRATLRATSAARFGSSDATHATLTVSAEQATLRENTVGTPLLPPDAKGQPPRGATPLVVSWESSTGLTTQGDVSINHTLFATAGVRLEHDSRLTDSDPVAVLPMVGVAGVHDYGALTVKLRGAYGEGVRPPSTATRLTLMQTDNSAATQSSLGPERQAGTEAGIELWLHHVVSLQATRFDQRASGLIQQVAMPADSTSRRVTYAFENVGQIANRGWELEATGGVSHLSLAGTLSLVDSRVEKVAEGYTGDLQPGDRMLEVPARTFSLNAGWTARRWFASLTASRALDWINYDELALARDYAGGHYTSHEFTGAQLRQYWARYDGGLRVRATLSRQIGQSFSLEFTGDNLLNYQRGEPDDVTITPGRTILTGLKARF